MDGSLTARAAVLAAMALAVWAAPASAQQVQKCDTGSGEAEKVKSPARYAIGPQEVVEIESRVDGVAIEIALFRPKGAEGERFPVIVNGTPYHHPQRSLDVTKCKPEFVQYAAHGYVVAFVAIRGTGESGGCMNLFGPDERADLSQAVDWLAQQPWSTGAVGMIGKSYEGSTPWMVAARGNKHLKTIVSMAGVPDVFELLFKSGNIDFRGPLLLNDLYYAPSVVVYSEGRRPERTLDVAACPEYATGNAASVYSSLTGEMDPFGYWAERRYKRQVERRYRGSVLVTQGFEDLNVPADNQFPWVQWVRKRGLPLKLMLGQWGHVNPDEASGDAQRKDWPDILLRWFDRWLKGGEVDTGPAVDVQDSEGKWRTASSWPPAEPPRRLWLGTDGTLRDEPDQGSASEPLLPDPVHMQPGTFSVPSLAPLDASCPLPTCTAFALGPAAEPLRFAGRPVLDMTVTPVAPAGHVSAYLYADNGTEAQRIGWGQADLRFPDGQEHARTVEPGEPVRLRLSFQPLDSVVPKGSRLVLVVSQGAAYDRIPSVPTAPALLTVGGRASSLRLALVTPEAAPAPLAQVAPARTGAKRAPSFRQIVSIRTTRRCGRRGRLRIAFRRGTKVAAVVVRVSGRRLVRRNSRRAIVLRAPRGRFRLDVAVTLADGAVVAGQRRFRSCRARR